MAETIEKKAVERKAIIDAISNLANSLESFPIAWEAVDELSSRTEVDSVEAAPDGVFIMEDGHFDAVGTIYVVLNYGGKRDHFSSNDSFPIQVGGKVDGTEAMIKSVYIDTSFFYGSETELAS